MIEHTLLRAARQIYRTYCEVRTKPDQRPTGVAINRFTHRGQVLFSSNPILLPEECFVPISQVESEIS